MRPYIFVLGCLTLLCSLLNLHAADEQHASQINWTTNYEQALSASKTSNKPVLLFFTGSDWCGWCKRLDQEALNTPEFAKAAGDKFIFVKIDFPFSNPLPADQTAHNKALQTRFDIRGFPTIVLLDSNEQQIGVTGYRPGGGAAYADHLLKMVQDYSAYKQKVGLLEKQPLSSEDLRGLYAKCRELNRTEDLNRIVTLGMKGSDPRFFLLEKYRLLADEGLIHDKEAIEIKKQLVALDPTNAYLTHYDVASIDFEAYSQEMEKDNTSPELAVEPFVTYIQKFGKQDPEHLWRLQMIISQVFMDKNNLPEALKYAQASLQAAPPAIKPDISVAIKNIQAQLNHNGTLTAQP